MIGYLIRRGGAMIPTLVGISIIVFLLIRLVPGDIVLVLAGARSDLTPEQYESIRQQLGLDRPLVVQYVDWASGVVRGDFGESLRTGRSIGSDIMARLPVTIELAILSAIIGMGIGIPAGIIAAIRRGSGTELAAQGIALLGLSIPDFWLGTMFILIASRYFQWYPGAQYISIREDPVANLTIFLLPAIAVGVGLSASLMRMTRSALLEVLSAGYITTARAKGLRGRTVLFRHALRSALIPVVTVIGLQVGYLMGGVVIVETVFNLPGLGRFVVDAIAARDYPVVQAVVLIVTMVVLLVNLVVDLLYGYLDPRIRYEESGS